MTLKTRNSGTGFTLIEILVVIAIIGLLVGIVAYNLQLRMVEGRQLSTKGTITQISLALETYRTDLGSYPPSNLLVEALEKGLGGSIRWHGPYFRFEKGRLGQTDGSGNLVNRRNTMLEFYGGANAEQQLLPRSANVVLDYFDRPMVYVPFREYAPDVAARNPNETGFVYFNPNSFQLYSFGHDGRGWLDGGTLVMLNWDDGIDNDNDGLTDKDDNYRTSPNPYLEDDLANW